MIPNVTFPVLLPKNRKNRYAYMKPRCRFYLDMKKSKLKCVRTISSSHVYMNKDSHGVSRLGIPFFGLLTLPCTPSRCGDAGKSRVNLWLDWEWGPNFFMFPRIHVWFRLFYVFIFFLSDPWWEFCLLLHNCKVCVKHHTWELVGDLIGMTNEFVAKREEATVMPVTLLSMVGSLERA